MKPKYQPHTNTELDRASFSPGEATYSFEELIENGALIKVTSWVTREMGFAKGHYRVHVAMTVKLWQVLHRIPKELTFFQTVRGRGHDVLWLAGWALQQARRNGMEHVKYLAVLPTHEDEEDVKLLRVECGESGDRQAPVVIGLPEEFPVIY